MLDKESQICYTPFLFMAVRSERGTAHPPESKEQIGRPPRVTIIADREWLNLDRTIRFMNTQPELLALGGIISVDGELDPIIKGLAYRYQNIALNGVHTTEIIDGRDTYGILFDSPDDHFRYHHAPYNPQQLGNNRERYAEDLATLVEYTKPNIVFLSNFYVILPTNFLERMRKIGVEVINVHPSFLPLLVGGRTEHRVANLRENPDASGFTIHRAENQLDKGVVYFQQKVRIDRYSKKLARQMGKAIYERDREERLRLKIIMAESRYAPAILAIIASDTPRAIIEDGEAFAIEGRRKFSHSEAYQQEIHKEYEEWSTSQKEPVSYEEWYRHIRKPYRRMLFKKDGKWQTLETILGAKQYAELHTPQPLRRYEVKIPSDNVAQIIELGKLHGKFFEDLYGTTFKPDGLVVRSSFVTGLDLSKRLRRIDPNFQTIDSAAPTRVGAPRKHTEWTVDSLPKIQEYTFSLPADPSSKELIDAIQSAIQQQTDTAGDLLQLGGGCWADVDEKNKLWKVHLQTVGNPTSLLHSFGVLIESVEFLSETGSLPAKLSKTASGLVVVQS